MNLAFSLRKSDAVPVAGETSANICDGIGLILILIAQSLQPSGMSVERQQDMQLVTRCQRWGGNVASFG